MDRICWVKRLCRYSAPCNHHLPRVLSCGTTPMLSQSGTSPVALRPPLHFSLFSQSCFLLWPGPLSLGQYWSILKSWTLVPTLSFRTALSHDLSGQSCMAPTPPPQGLQIPANTLTHSLSGNECISSAQVLTGFIPCLQNFQDHESWF